MSIHKIGSDLIRPFGTKGTTPAADSSAAEGADDAQRTPRADRVEISRQGRELAAQLDTRLTPERTAEIRQRIDSGFYDSPDVAGQVARGVMDSGDIAV